MFAIVNFCIYNAYITFIHLSLSRVELIVSCYHSHSGEKTIKILFTSDVNKDGHARTRTRT